MLYTSPPPNFTADLEVAGCVIEPGCWGSAVGRVEEGENHFEAMLREVQEETGIELEKETPQFIQTVYCDQFHHKVIYHLYHCVFQTQPKIQLAEEHQDMQWIKPKEALRLDLMEDEDTCIRMLFSL